MLKDPSAKYRPFPAVQLPDRQWPNRTLTRAPMWCSVDLRDGNQALAIPMNVGQKLELQKAVLAVSLDKEPDAATIDELGKLDFVNEIYVCALD